MATTLDENLALALKAAHYAKIAAPRSANQKYFKRHDPNERDRTYFLLGMTRNSTSVRAISRDANGNATAVADDPQRKASANIVKNILAHYRNDVERRNAEIDKLVKAWGRDYFWSGAADRTSKQKLDPNFNNRFQQATGATNIFTSDGQYYQPQLWADYWMAESAKYAAKYGVGNCGEKSCLVTEYILKHGPQGLRVARVELDPNHQNPDGTGGDHAFSVIGQPNELVAGCSTAVGCWGSNAVIVDGWMNDAYPAQHPFQWKYGYNYNRERVNLKQLAIRTLICVHFRAHIKVIGAWLLGPANTRHAATPAAGFMGKKLTAVAP